MRMIHKRIYIIIPTLLIIISCGGINYNVINNVYIPKTSLKYLGQSNDTVRLQIIDSSVMRDPYIDNEIISYLMFKALESTKERFGVYSLTVNFSESKKYKKYNYTFDEIQYNSRKFNQACYMAMVSNIFNDTESREGLSYLYLLNYLYGYYKLDNPSDEELYNENFFELLDSICNDDKKAKTIVNKILQDLKREEGKNSDVLKNSLEVAGKIETIIETGNVYSTKNK